MAQERSIILAVDDDPDDLAALGAIVAEALPHCSLLTALNGASAVERAIQVDPDVILIDMAMSDTDAVEVCRRFKTNEQTHQIPIVFLTDRDTGRESRVAALEVGASGFLSKPMDEQELIAQVRAMTRLKAATKLQPSLHDERFQRPRVLETEFTGRMATEEARRADLERRNAEWARDFLQVLNAPSEWLPMLRQVLVTLKKMTGVDAVGIRVQVGEDLNCAIHDGFSDEFVSEQGALLEDLADGGVCRDGCGAPCLDCACGLVLSGNACAGTPFCTPGGSFCVGDLAAIPSFPEPAGPRYCPTQACLRFGYSSMALVPIRMGDRIVGHIHLSDRRCGGFCHGTLEILEGMASHIERTIQHRRTEEKLEEALARAEWAAGVKSDFLSVMSHELRTPLNGVLGFAEILSDTPLDPLQQSYVRTICQSGSLLLSVVDDILDFSSIEKGQLNIQDRPIELAAILRSTDMTVRKLAAEKSLDFRWVVEPGVPTEIVGDEKRISQILFNLLENAVKFSSGGSVVLQVSAAGSERCPELEFTVCDTGIGIAPEVLPLIFHPFIQGDASLRRKCGGTGLGLAISHRLAKAMDGSISVESTLGQGSKFTFHLPVVTRPGALRSQPAPDGVAVPGPNRCAPQRGKPVLVVEDDPTSCRLAGAMLTALGLGVEVAGNGQEACDAFQLGRFAAILMDMQMPLMDGLDATRIIREREKAGGERVPIIALTANVLPTDLDRCRAAGMDDCLTKPFNKEALVEKLFRFIQ